MVMGTLQEELNEVLHAMQTHTNNLFETLSQNASVHRWHGTSKHDVNEILSSLSRLDASLESTLANAAEHQANQRKIQPLVNQIQQRDTQQRNSIAQVAKMRSELQVLLRAADEQREELQRAEKGTATKLIFLDPLSAADVLAYAQRLARYTSAPPGYKLNPEPRKEETEDAEIPYKLAPDYNPKATRAAGYYDPEMPSMPQELPFPSDRQLRQGILYADAAGVVSQPEDTHDTDTRHDADAKLDPNTSATFVETNPPHHALESFAMDDEDAFDLDLNP
ncbi:hypothetical protein MYAM1_002071 [Malassezia yamatoensis]|uniref:Mediator of RNA polymerase II transcription subunit 4 n=1 Tax=Malassezia yamatoensis TaxID=253288 RepID=A0AAJ6CGF8_9BASI|nr:hypothetical protein MYAM1_002071 [Malassezia yamatoensis]